GEFVFGGNGTQVAGAGNGDTGEFTRILRCYSGDRLGANSLDHFAGDGATLRFSDFLAYLSPRTADGIKLICARPYPMGYSSVAGLPAAATPLQLKNAGIYGLLYPNWVNVSGQGGVPMHQIATALRDPPPELQSNAGLQALRGCAWF